MFDNYQKGVKQTFKPHEPLTAEQAALVDWVLGINGEVGEVTEAVKHYLFSHEDKDRYKIAKELGDVLWYLSAIATEYELDLQDIADLNTAKLLHRYPTGKYTDEDSANRHKQEKKFEQTVFYQIMMARLNKTPAPMNIIFIGPDGSGKTTLSKAIATKFGFKYVKCNYEQEDKTELALTYLTSQTNVVYDRFYYPDEVIYCHAKDIEKPKEYWDAFNEVLYMLERTNTLMIYVTASDEVLRERSSKWADEYITVDMLPKIKKLYERFMSFLNSRRIGTTVIDTSELSIDAAIQACAETIEEGQKVYARIYKPEDIDETTGAPIIEQEEVANGINGSQA